MSKKQEARRIVVLRSAVCALFLIAVTATVQSADNSYHFPVRGGTEEWKAFTSHVQMLEACMVPEDLLATMSTEGLIKTCMDYPLKNDLGNYNDFQKGFECVTGGFNGLQELLKKKDASAKLIAYYSSMKPEAFNRTLSIADKGFYAFDIMYVEMILAQSQILDNLTAQEQKELLSMCLEKSEVRTDYQNVYDDSRFHIGWALLVGKLLQKLNYQPAHGNISTTDYNHFLEYGNTTIDNAFLQQIHFNGKAFLDPDILKRGYSPRKFILPDPGKDTTIFTPNGSSYRCKVYVGEKETLNNLKNWYQYNASNYPNAIPLEPYATQEYGTGNFNCHSYGLFWEDTLPKIQLWIGNPAVFYTDGSLKEISDTVNGCRIILWKGSVGTSYMEHTMTLVPRRGKQCTSKWGNNPVYAHDYDYHCYSFQNSTPCDYADVTNGPYNNTDIKVQGMLNDMPFAHNIKVIKGKISIEISEPTSFAVYNMAGQLVYKEKPFKTKRAVLDLTRCGTGMYAIKQISDNKGANFYKVAIND